MDREGQDVARILDLPPPPAPRLPYGPGTYHIGELRVPPGPGPHPVVIAIHGGFWRARYDLAHLGHLCAALTSAGLATWNVEYRRIGNPGGGWPGTFIDVGRAADFLRAIAPVHHLAVDRALALGHSAGGHLALWLAGRRHLPAGTDVSAADPLPLCGAISLAGVADLRLAYNWNLSDGAVADLLGGGPEDVPQRYVLASPAAQLPLRLPQILLHGLEDEDVPYAMSEHYCAEAAAAGDAVQLVPLYGMGHFEPIDPASAAWPQVLQSVQELVT